MKHDIMEINFKDPMSEEDILLQYHLEGLPEIIRQ